ncbi:MAG: sensor histidine kinase [Clostridium sp.]|nr:sensor histidine kinase [Clostridium sp.]
MKISNFISDLKFRYKLLITYILLGFIPIAVLAVIWYNQTKEIVINQEKGNIRNYLTQAVSNMDNQLRIYNNLSDYIGFNQTISNVVSHNYQSYYEMYDQFSSMLDPMLSSLKYFHSDINRVTIYAREDIVKHDTTIAPISDIEKQPWFQDLNDNSNIHWYVSKENRKAFSARNMPTLHLDSGFGVLYLDVDYGKLFESFNNMKDSNYGIFIVDKDGNNILDISQFEDKNRNMSMSYDEYKFKKDTNKLNDYATVECKSNCEDWSVILYKPESLIYNSINTLFTKTLGVILFLIVSSFITSTLLSKFMVSDIEKLRADMENVENGDMNVTINSNRHDEIGTLIRGFRNMIFQIKSLIEDVYESKIIQKDYEMKALQAQINPHFLYNTLSLINWMAIEAQQEEISKITLSLSTFYRTALNKGKNILTVRDELKNTKSYLDIQLMMHDYEFDVVMNIDDCILEYQILNLILQPLVENAIDHGIDLKTSGRGKITITGKIEDNNIYLIVGDNGVGMEQDKIDTILTNKSKGYGVRNVNERIKLYYGEQYSLHVESEIGKGTSITVKIPAEN